MDNNPEAPTIGAFAKAGGVKVETIRFRERRGVLPWAGRPLGSIRHDGNADAARVCFVKSARSLGFSLDEVAELLRLEDGLHCHEVSELAQRTPADVRKRLADMQRMQAALSRLIGKCHTRRGNVPCPLISSLQAGRRAME